MLYDGSVKSADVPSRPTPLESTRAQYESAATEAKEYEEIYQNLFASLQIAKKNRDDAVIRANCLKQALSEMRATDGDITEDEAKQRAALQYNLERERERLGRYPSAAEMAFADRDPA